MIVLRMGEYELAVDVEDRETTISEHTGRSLEVVTGTVSTADEAADTLLQGLLAQYAGKPVPSQSRNGAPEMEWLVEQQSYSYSGNRRTGTTYTLKLTEFESRRASQLILGDLTLEPYAYREKVRNGRMTVSAKVRADRPTAERLQALVLAQEPLTVRRIGVSEDPRTMFVGDFWYSKDGDTQKFALTLDDVGSNDEHRPDPERDYDPGLGIIGNSARDFAYLLGRVRTLEKLLIERGVLQEGDVDTIRQRAREAEPQAWYDVHEVGDIDLF